GARPLQRLARRTQPGDGGTVRSRIPRCARDDTADCHPERSEGSFASMTLHTYGLYLAAVLLISATPGPNIFYVTTRSIRFGFGPALLALTREPLQAPPPLPTT